MVLTVGADVVVTALVVVSGVLVVTLVVVLVRVPDVEVIVIIKVNWITNYFFACW